MNNSLIKSVKIINNPPSIKSEIDIVDFIESTKHNNEVMDGLIESPYYEVTYNGINEVYSYATPLYSTSSLFSFGYIEATEDMFPITISITAKGDKESLSYAKVIPEKLGVETTVVGGKVSFTINSFDYYTVLFDADPDKEFVDTYTLMVRKYEELEVPSGYKLIEYGPGIHYVDRILTTVDNVESNTMIYLHSGAYIVCKQPNDKEKAFIDGANCKNWAPFINVSNAKNVLIKGHGVIDASNLSLHARTPIMINSSINITIDGTTIINSPSWTVYALNCKNVKIKNVIMLGYRINSDGIVPCNCKNVLVENCFAKSGDDLFQAKAQSASANVSQTGGSNITYKHCQAWAEKTRCFGFIQETEMDAENIVFKDCSVLYHDAVWEEAMGAFVVCVGDSSTVKKIKFINCDAYHSEGYVINIYLGDNQWTTNPNQGCLGKIHGVKFRNFSFRSKYLKRKHPIKKEQPVAVLLKNKKTVAKSNAQDFTGIVFNKIVIDDKLQNKNSLLKLTNCVGEINVNDKSQIKII